MRNDFTMLERWGSFVVRKRWFVLAISVVMLAALAVLAMSLSEGTVSSLSVPGAESPEAIDLLDESFPERSGDYGDIVLRSGDSLEADGTLKAVETLVGDVAAIPGVVSVSSPFAVPSGLLSADGRTGIVRVQFSTPADELSSDTIFAVDAAMVEARGQGRRALDREP